MIPMSCDIILVCSKMFVKNENLNVKIYTFGFTCRRIVPNPIGLTYHSRLALNFKAHVTVVSSLGQVIVPVGTIYISMRKTEYILTL